MPDSIMFESGVVVVLVHSIDIFKISFAKGHSCIFIYLFFLMCPF